MTRADEIGLLGIERKEHVVGSDPFVEGIDEALEEPHAADP